MITELSDLHRTWAARFNDRDLEGLLALAEDGCTVVPQPGTVVRTTEEYRGALQWFLGLNAPVTMNVRYCIENGDLGLVIADWELIGTAEDGSPMPLRGSTADVARRGPDGWKVVIDNPFGTA